MVEDAWRRAVAYLPGLEEDMMATLEKHGARRTVESTREPIPTCLRPVAVSRALYEDIKTAAVATLSLGTKGLDIVSLDVSLRNKSGYQLEDWDLYASDHTFNKGIPQIARVDLTLSGNKLTVFEINSDSPGGMYHLDVIASQHADFCEALREQGVRMMPFGKQRVRAVTHSDVTTDECREAASILNDTPQLLTQ